MYLPYKFLKCSSTGFATTTAETKVPLTKINTEDHYAVASDTITVGGDGVYAFTANIQLQSVELRLQAVLKVYVNGVYDGIERGAAYIRNSGASYDFWSLRAYTVLELNKDDTVELYVDTRTGATYGNQGTFNYSMHNTGNEIIMERRS